jgi:two-component system, cell cycle sensor histidine kinase and response regulator CckA
LQRFEAIGRLAGGIAHDFNNALGVILGWAQLGYEELPEGNSTRKKLEMICQQAQNTAGLSRQLLAFARRQILQPSNLGIGDLLTQSKRLLESVIGDEIDFTVTLSPDLGTIRADRSQIEQVLMNLCLNARDAMAQGGRLTVKAENREISDEFCRIHSFGAPGRYVLIEISDTGTGMDAATLDHIFEPFFTTKEMSRGTGLGLATVYGIVKQHGGFVNVYSELGHGSTFRIYLPSVSGAPDKPPAALPYHAQRGTETILVADDHAALRDLARDALTSQGYRVIVAHDGQEAVDCFKANSKQVRLVMLDVTMPRLNGREAYSQMCTVVPDLPVIFTTGHSAEAACLESNILEGAAFLQKPYDLKLLYRAVRTTLDSKGGRPHTSPY